MINRYMEGYVNGSEKMRDEMQAESERKDAEIERLLGTCKDKADLLRAAYEQNERKDAEIARLRITNADLLEALRECADDLEALIEDEYKDTKDVYTSSRRRYQRDIAPVRKARAVIVKATGEKE